VPTRADADDALMIEVIRGLIARILLFLSEVLSLPEQALVCASVGLGLQVMTHKHRLLRTVQVTQHRQTEKGQKCQDGSAMSTGIIPVAHT
jgi:hypothetical protein